MMEHRFARSVKLEALLQEVTDDCCLHYLSEGNWFMHELLIGLLGITGPADVWLSSYAFSTHPARIIEDLKKRNWIRELHCLIDSRIDTRTAPALDMIRNVSTSLKVVNTHAKVTVLENEKMMVAIVGSSNYTTNKRYEAGMIIVNREVAAFHKQWMQHELNKKEKV
jgi:hypothetical protein